MDYGRLLEDLLAILNRLRESLVDLSPHLLGALLILLIGFLAAGLGRFLVVRLLDRFHLIIPKSSVRGRVERFLKDRSISKTVAGIVYWTVVFFFLTAATETLGLPAVTVWLSGITGYLPRILSAFLIGAAGMIAGVIAQEIIVTGAVSAGLVYAHALGRLAKAGVIVVSLLVALDQVGIDVGFLESVFIVMVAALLLGAALAFGFGAKDSVQNILGAYYLQKVYQTGDLIEIGGKRGTIVEITPVRVIIDSPEGRTSVPGQEFNRLTSVLLPKEA
jgi:small-conductance mechanosensitive channel